MKRVAIDVGGTFTDCLVMDESGQVLEFKAASTPQDYTLGFLEALRKACRKAGDDAVRADGGARSHRSRCFAAGKELRVAYTPIANCIQLFVAMHNK